MNRLEREKETEHWTDMWPKLTEAQQKCNLRKTQKILATLPTVKATGSRKRKATDQPTRNTKYMRGVSVGETTTRLPSNDSDGTAKYKKKKSTADKQMFNSDETGFDILAWVSSKTFDSYFMNYIYSVIFCYRKFKLTFKLAQKCYAFVLTLCIRTWLPTVLITVEVKRIFSSKGFFLVYSGTQFF